jgi:hypothetical protein
MRLLAGKRQGNRHTEKPSSFVSQSLYLGVFAPLADVALAKSAVHKLNRKKPDSRIAVRSFISSRDTYVSHGCQARLTFAVKRARSGGLQRRDGCAQDGSAVFQGFLFDRLQWQRDGAHRAPAALLNAAGQGLCLRSQRRPRCRCKS